MKYWLATLLFLSACNNDGESEPTTTTIRVGTWNVFLRPIGLEGGLLPRSDPRCRATEAGRYLATAEPSLDFVGLQEVLDAELGELLFAELDAEFPQVEGPRPEPCERDGECFPQSGGHALAARGSLTIGATDALGYHECTGSDCLANKGILYAPVSLSDGDSPDLHIVVTHLQASGSSQSSAAEIRASQYEDIRNYLEPKVCQEGVAPKPVILLGDLNTAYFAGASTGNEEYESAIEALRLSCLGVPTDVFAEFPSEQGTLNCAEALLPTPCESPLPARIDHIWYWAMPNQLEVTETGIDAVASDACEPDYLSDHRLVFADITL